MFSYCFQAMIAKTNVGMAARSASFSADGEMLAVGLKNGTLLLMKTSDLKIITQKRDRRSAISDVRYLYQTFLFIVSNVVVFFACI